jgi:hypothetical protein
MLRRLKGAVDVQSQESVRIADARKVSARQGRGRSDGCAPRVHWNLRGVARSSALLEVKTGQVAQIAMQKVLKGGRSLIYIELGGSGAARLKFAVDESECTCLAASFNDSAGLHRGTRIAQQRSYLSRRLLLCKCV